MKFDSEMNRQFFFKIISCLLFAVLGSNTAWAVSTTYYYSATASVAEGSTGLGKVYVAKSSTEDEKSYLETGNTITGSGSSKTATLYFFAQPNEGYAFKSWTDANGKEKSTARIFETTEEVTSTSSSNRTQITYYANFLKEGLVTVRSSNESLGSATIDNVQNGLGDEVTLKASLVNIFLSKFKGWAVDGSDEIVSTENPYTVTVTEKKTYRAIFEATDGLYCRVHSARMKKYYTIRGNYYTRSNSSSDGFTGAIFMNSLVSYPETAKFKGKLKVVSDPGSIFFVNGEQNGSGLKNTGITGQGVSTYDVISGSGFAIALTTTKHTATINKVETEVYKMYGSISGSRYLKDGSAYGGRCAAKNIPDGFGGTTSIVPAILCGGDDQDVQYWVEPITEESMDTYYFGAAPDETSTALNPEGEERYWTTLYTAFPYKCHDGVRAYIVDRIQGAEVHLKEILSGEVPSKTPVILECKGTTADQNRLVPLAKEPEAVEGNLLVGRIDYDNNEVNYGDASYKFSTYRLAFNPQTMRVFGAAGATFSNQNTEVELADNDGAVSQSYITSNSAYLPVTEDTPETLTFCFDELPDPVDVDGYVQIRNGGDAYLSISTDGGKASVSKSADEADKDPGAFFRLTAKTGDDPLNAPATLFEAQGYDFNEVAAGQLYLSHVDGKDDTYYIYTLSEGQPAYLTAADGTVSKVTDSSLLGAEAEWTMEPAGEDNPVRLPVLTLTAEDNGAPRYYTTFYSSFAYTLGEGMKAYYVEKLDDNGLMTVVKPYMGDVVPAYTGVILECERAEGNTLVPTTADVDPIADNLLHGTLQANTVLNDKETMRAFNQRDGRLAFYTLSLEYIPATNRAYLLLPEGDDGEVKLITFDSDDQPTAVETIERVNADALTGEVFDLNGRKVSRPQRGIYILNGKKVLIW